MSAWLPSSVDPLATQLRLFCFPHAGGGSAIYHGWQRSLPASISVIPVKLPGRESRLQEPAFDELQTLLDAIWEQPEFQQLFAQPLALFGHSVGGLVAYELAQRLVAAGNVPSSLIVSATRSPDRIQAGDNHQLPDDELIERVISLYSDGQTVSSGEREMMSVLAPTIRADLKMIETYEFVAQSPLPCPLLALGGSDDQQVTRSDVQGWRSFTSGRFKSRILPGPHLFLHERKASVLDLITSQLVS